MFLYLLLVPLKTIAFSSAENLLVLVQLTHHSGFTYTDCTFVLFPANPKS